MKESIYYAIKNLNKIYKAEQLVEKFLAEGSDYRGKAVTLLTNSGLFTEEVSKQIISGLFYEDIHAFHHAPAWLEKYLIGIVKQLIMYSDGSKDKAREFLEQCPDVYDYYLTYVKEVRPQLSERERTEFDKKFNQSVYEDIVQQVTELKNSLNQADNEKLKNQQFDNSSDYKLIPITSYSQMNKEFGGALTGSQKTDRGAQTTTDGGAWCHTNSENIYNSWVSNNRYQFFVLAKNGWENIKFNAETNSQNPKDQYGTSLIAILVNKVNHQLERATLRCNHVGVHGDADHQYRTYSELNELVGFNVKEEIDNYLGEIKEKKVDWSTFNGTREWVIENIGEDYMDITSVIIPDSVEYIYQNAFYNCSSLKSIIIPNSVKEIGGYAFAHCTSLKSIIIPNSVKGIRGYAFAGCTSLKSITIPASVEKIGDCVFDNCNSLKSVTLSDSLSHIENYAFSNCRSLESITIPNSVKGIGDYAFYKCTSLKSITIPNSVKEIGDYAFYGCTSLESITIPNSVKGISDYAFTYCTSLKSITIPNSVKRIGYYAFSHCASLESITIPNSVEKIYNHAFYNCTSLKSITIPNSVEWIGDHAFYGCRSLKSITIPNSVKRIGYYAFYNCSSLESITIPNSVKGIGDCAFLGCSPKLIVHRRKI